MPIRYVFAAAIGLLISSSSQAAIYNLTPLSNGGDDYTFNVSALAPGKGNFTDTFKFTIPGTVDPTLSAILINISASQRSNIDFTSAAISGLSLGPAGIPLSVSNSGDESLIKSLTPINMVAGQMYELSVSYFSGGANASYNGNLSTTAAVPELATWTMLLVGIGMIGAGMRRQQRVRIGAPTQATSVSCGAKLAVSATANGMDCARSLKGVRRTM